MRILKPGMLYFALVFGASFVLGNIRKLWVVPRLRTRMAELMETPIMLVITILAARKFGVSLCSPRRCPTCYGFRRGGLLLAAEFTLVPWLRGMSIREYFASRDPVYHVMPGVFAIMPMARR